jgi:hypothetical protein
MRDAVFMTAPRQPLWLAMPWDHIGQDRIYLLDWTEVAFIAMNIDL